MSYNTKNLVVATGYYHELQRDIDDAYWCGMGDMPSIRFKEILIQDVKEHIDRGDAWYPKF
jgi:hypothetical protein